MVTPEVIRFFFFSRKFSDIERTCFQKRELRSKRGLAPLDSLTPRLSTWPFIWPSFIFKGKTKTFIYLFIFYLFDRTSEKWKFEWFVYFKIRIKSSYLHPEQQRVSEGGRSNRVEDVRQTWWPTVKRQAVWAKHLSSTSIKVISLG